MCAHFSECFLTLTSNAKRQHTKQSLGNHRISSSELIMIPVNIYHNNYHNNDNAVDDDVTTESSEPEDYTVNSAMTMENDDDQLTKEERKKQEDQRSVMKKQLQSVGIGIIQKDRNDKLRKMLAKIVLPYVTFAADEQLQSDREIAQVVFSHLNQVKERKITDDIWKENWVYMSKILKQELMKYRSYHSSQLGRILLGKLLMIIPLPMIHVPLTLCNTNEPRQPVI